MTLLDAYDILVDSHVGIIHSVQEDRREAGAPDFLYYLARTCKTSALNPDHDQGALWGSGVSTDRELSNAKAIGEAIERYCASNYDTEAFPLTTYESASFPCVPPDTFALFSAKQYNEPGFPYRPFTRRSKVRWVPAIDLYTKETVYVPAAMVFLPYLRRKKSGEQLLTPQISTGLACHTNKTMASFAGISEVIERDAFTITWQARLPRPKIRLDSLSAQNVDLLGRLRRPGATVTLLYLHMDHDIPVILSAMTSTVRDAPALVVAAASHLDPERAVQKSLEELAQSASFAQTVKSSRPRFNPGKRWEHVVDPTSHASVYFDHASAPMADFLFSSTEQIAFSAIKNVATHNPTTDLHLLVERVHKIKHRVIVADVTTDDVRDLGLVVLRTLIPGFHPLFMGHRSRALGGRRLWEVPRKLGLAKSRYGRIDNPFPHPFP